MTISRSCVTLVVLALFSAPAFAEGGGDPGDAVDQVDAPKPKIISSGQGEGGRHAFLAMTPKGPMVFVGTPGDLEELDVLGMRRIDDGFAVDTLEEGELAFGTRKGEHRVIQKGIVGFNSPRPTTVMAGPADRALYDQVMQRIGGAAPKTSGVTVEPGAHGLTIVRFPSALAVPGGKLHGPASHTTTAIRARAKQARTRGRVRTRGRLR